MSSSGDSESDLESNSDDDDDEGLAVIEWFEWVVARPLDIINLYFKGSPQPLGFLWASFASLKSNS